MKTKKQHATFAETSHSEEQAKAQLASIIEMVAALDGEDQDSARTTIEEDALDVQIRADWHTPGMDKKDIEYEYSILLCTGGPACRIVGDLDECMQPATARIEHQDWGTLWTVYHTMDEEKAALLTYAGCFYFGE